MIIDKKNTCEKNFVALNENALKNFSIHDKYNTLCSRKAKNKKHLREVLKRTKQE